MKLFSLKLKNPKSQKTFLVREKGLRPKFIIAAIVIGLNSFNVFAQPDSTILTYYEYLDYIFQYHPIAKKAELKLSMAKVEMIGAKGKLDPILTSDWNQKDFDDKLYYRQYQAKIKFPTRLGIDVVGGYENTDGVYLNPENTTDAYGLWHLGVELDVLQGFFMNDRKAALKKASVFQELAKNERQIILNELMYNASAAYLIWQQYEYFKKVLNENKVIAKTYFENTKESFLNGEKTAMDTLETFILFQDAITLIQKNELGLVKARQNIENYLWYNDMAVTLQQNTKPENYYNEIWPISKAFDDSDLSSHPILLASVGKLSYLEIEQKLNREKLKPKLKIKYNPLLATSQNSIAPTYSLNDYRWGFNFSMPLLLRSERAGVQKGEIVIQETKLDIQNKRNELQNKIESSWIQQQLLHEQIVLLSNNVESYKILLEGENEKFKMGESSVFLLNKRQEKYIDGRLKLITTSINKQVEILNFLYFSNQLINE